MKKEKAGKKMVLKKATVSDLNENSMNEVRGGTYTSTPIPGCICDSEIFCTCPRPCPV